jgi:ubiquitin C-terminal hydrolase
MAIITFNTISTTALSITIIIITTSSASTTTTLTTTIKVDTLKRCCIKEAPRNLILHLKRFEFDFDSMRKIKINDYCEFPLLLDLEPYTEAHLEKKAQAQAQAQAQGQGQEQGQGQGQGQGETQGSQVPPSSPAGPSGNPNKNTLYELTGVLVHTGTCNSGHYYSFIKERDGSGQWHQFNDTKVTPHHCQNIPQ